MSHAVEFLFAGLLPLSLNDYPGHVSAVIFFTGCNYFCPYCHNPLLAQGKIPDDFIPLNDIFTYLDKNKNNLDGVVVSGGEPTINKDISTIIATIHALRLKVKLDTNGSNPDYIKLLEFTSTSSSGILLSSIQNGTAKTALLAGSYNRTAVVPVCSDVTFDFDAAPPSSKVMRILFNVVEHGVTCQRQISGNLRGWAGNLLNSTGTAIVSDDD